MSIENDITQAKNPREAVLILARAIDAINRRLDEQPAADPWASWGDAPEPDDVTEQTAALAKMEIARNEQAIAATKQQIAAATDPEDIQALTARLRLLDEKGAALDLSVPVGQRADISSDGTNGEVALPPVSEERKAERAKWAMSYRLHEYIPLDQDAAILAFAAGGPVWLILANRDAVMQMPFAARQWLIEDILKDSPAQAQEFGRDILKSEESVDRAMLIDSMVPDA